MCGASSALHTYAHTHHKCSHEYTNAYIRICYIQSGLPHMCRTRTHRRIPLCSIFSVSNDRCGHQCVELHISSSELEGSPFVYIQSRSAISLSGKHVHVTRRHVYFESCIGLSEIWCFIHSVFVYMQRTALPNCLSGMLYADMCILNLASA